MYYVYLHIGLHLLSASTLTHSIITTLPPHVLPQKGLPWLATRHTAILHTSYQHGRAMITERVAYSVVMMPSSATRGQMLLEQKEAWVT